MLWLRLLLSRKDGNWGVRQLNSVGNSTAPLGRRRRQSLRCAFWSGVEDNS